MGQGLMAAQEKAQQRPEEWQSSEFCRVRAVDFPTFLLVFELGLWEGLSGAKGTSEGTHLPETTDTTAKLPPPWHHYQALLVVLKDDGGFKEQHAALSMTKGSTHMNPCTLIW